MLDAKTGARRERRRHGQGHPNGSGSKGLASQAKRADREASEGAVAVGRTGNAASIVQLRSETDFVAKSDEFVALVTALADLVADQGRGCRRRAQPTRSTT